MGEWMTECVEYALRMGAGALACLYATDADAGVAAAGYAWRFSSSGCGPGSAPPGCPSTDVSKTSSPPP